MRIRNYLGAGIGLLVGTLIGQWALAGSTDKVLETMGLVCGGTGGVAGFATVNAGTRKKQMLCVGVGLGLCLLVAGTMLLYRWIVR